MSAREDTKYLLNEKSVLVILGLVQIKFLTVRTPQNVSTPFHSTLLPMIRTGKKSLALFVRDTVVSIVLVARRDKIHRGELQMFLCVKTCSCFVLGEQRLLWRDNSASRQSHCDVLFGSETKA